MINNQLIIDEREVGKTTYLYTEAVKCKSMGLPLFILDSATEHVEKSLLNRAENATNETKIISLFTISELLGTKPSEILKEVEDRLPKNFSILDKNE